MSDSFVTAQCYVVVEADTNSNGFIRDRGKVDRATARPPFLQGAQVGVRLTLRIPKKAFSAAVAEAVIDVPAELVSTPDVTVTVAE